MFKKHNGALDGNPAVVHSTRLCFDYTDDWLMMTLKVYGTKTSESGRSTVLAAGLFWGGGLLGWGLMTSSLARPIRAPCFFSHRPRTVSILNDSLLEKSARLLDKSNNLLFYSMTQIDTRLSEKSILILVLVRPIREYSYSTSY